MTNDPANTIDWPIGSIVIHDADAKTTEMLMLVIDKATKGRYAGMYKTKYINRKGNCPFYWNGIKPLHDPRNYPEIKL